MTNDYCTTCSDMRVLMGTLDLTPGPLKTETRLQHTEAVSGDNHYELRSDYLKR